MQDKLIRKGSFDIFDYNNYHKWIVKSHSGVAFMV